MKNFKRQNPFLFIGPTTLEAIKNINKYSYEKNRNIAFVTTRNQIETSTLGKGYVNLLNTITFSKIIRDYKNSRLSLARDHCGPFINGKHDIKKEISNCIETVNEDILNHFSFIHLDMSHIKKNNKKIDILQKIYSESLIKDSKIKLEVGINKHEGISSYNEIKFLIKEFNVSQLEYITISNGTYIKECYQKGKYREKNTIKINKFLHNKNILIKDHNSDYLEFNDIYNRLLGGVNSMNIQPQIAYIENSLIFYLTNKMKLHSELNNCYYKLIKNKNLKKWTLSKNKETVVKLGLHYIQNEKCYINMIEKIKKKTNYTYLFKMLVYNLLDKYYLAYDSFHTMRRNW